MRGKTFKETQLKFHKVEATSTLLYGSEAWLRGKKGESGIKAAEMRFLTSMKGCTKEENKKRKHKR
jgi:hypothetical protein